MLGDPASCRELWFVLHGYRQLAERFIRRFAALPGIGDSRAVVAPEALSRFYIEEEVGPHGPETRVGATWMTRADREHEIRDYVEYLDRLADTVLGREVSGPATEPGPAGLPRVVILGFSQGAETASRWVVLGRTRPHELVLWGGGLAVDLEADAVEGALRDVDVKLVVGSDDAWAASRASETLQTLDSLHVDVRRMDYEGRHTIAADVLRRHWVT